MTNDKDDTDIIDDLNLFIICVRNNEAEKDKNNIIALEEKLNVLGKEKSTTLQLDIEKEYSDEKNKISIEVKKDDEIIPKKESWLKKLVKGSIEKILALILVSAYPAYLAYNNILEANKTKKSVENMIKTENSLYRFDRLSKMCHFLPSRYETIIKDGLTSDEKKDLEEIFAELMWNIDTIKAQTLPSYVSTLKKDMLQVFKENYEVTLPEATDYIQTHLNVSKFFLDIGRYDLSLKFSETSFYAGLDKRYEATALYLRGYAYHALGEYEIAEEEFQKAIKKNKNNKAQVANSYCRIGDIHYITDKDKDSYTVCYYYDKALEIDPNCIEAYHSKASYYFMLSGDFIIDAEIAYRENRRSVAKSYYKKAQEYLSKSKDIIQKAIDIDPSNSESHHILGRIYMKEGKFEKAKECFYKAINCDRFAAESYLQLAVICRCVDHREGLSSHYYHKAIEIATRLIKPDKNGQYSSDYYSIIGRYNAQLKQENCDEIKKLLVEDKKFL